jgi:plasmid stabilization system protein ParE
MSGTQEVVVKNIDYFMANQGEYDALSESQILELTQNGQLAEEAPAPAASADAAVDDKATETAEEIAAKAAAAAAEAEAAKVADQAKTGADDGKPTGILSKDGNHVIPYTRLEESQAEAARFKQLAETQAQLIATLTAAKEADDVSGGTKAQDEVLAQLNEDFPELAEKLGPVLKVMIEQGVKTTVGALEAKVNELIKPLQTSVEESSADKHFNAIREAHSDFNDLMKGDTVDKWIETQPAFVRSRYAEVLEKGTASEVIELIGAFKEATKPAEVIKTPTAEEVAAAAAAKVAEASKSTGVPKSMSDIPSGSATITDELAAIADLSPMAMIAKFEGKTPEQINAMVGKLV